MTNWMNTELEDIGNANLMVSRLPMATRCISRPTTAASMRSTPAMGWNAV
ncbi:MAG: hypothetical protein R2848_00945 [Thermomicrobiales bacterium]